MFIENLYEKRATSLMDIFKFDYSNGNTNWEIVARLDGGTDNYGKNIAHTEITQCRYKCKCKRWKISDEQLVRHTGCEMYYAFYKVIKYNKEVIKYYDFDEQVLNNIKSSNKIDEKQVEKIENSIKKYKTCDYLDLWREVKATLASAIVIISSFDWVHYQKESCKLSSHSESMIEYLIYSLTFISKRNQCNSLFAQDILNHLQRHRCLYPDNIKIKICIGIEPISSYTTDDDECDIVKALDNNDNWWEFFWISIILILIIFIVILIAGYIAKIRGKSIKSMYGGEPFRLRIFPPI